MIEREETELPDANYEGEWYRWSCGRCGHDEFVEWDPRGTEVRCDDCDTVQRVPA